MYCLIAVEKEVCEVVRNNLERKFPDWLFETAVDASQLERAALKRPDVLVLSRHLPGEKPTVLLKHLPLLFPASHIVLLVGTLNEEAKAYIRASKKEGLENIVTGKLPGDKPYTIFTALTEARKELLELAGEEVEEEPRTEAKKETVKAVIREEPEDEPVLRYSLPKQKPKPQKRRRQGAIVAVTSNKGGVGKTTVAISLALTLTQCGVETALCDLDLGAPDVATFFDIKNVPGIEALSGKHNIEHYMNDLLVEKNGLHILPGVMDKTLPLFSAEEIAEIAEVLAGEHQIVICDTPPEFWTKEYLEELFPKADLVLSVVDQSKFSEAETRDYAPKLVMMGVIPSRIKIVCNRFNPKLHNPRKVEAYFNQGFKKGKDLPSIIAVIPENWEEFVKKTYRGEIAGEDGKHSPWRKLAESVAEELGLPLYVEKPAKRSLFDIFKRR